MDRPGPSGVRKSKHSGNLNISECIEIINDSGSELEIQTSDSFFSSDEEHIGSDKGRKNVFENEVRADPEQRRGRVIVSDDESVRSDPRPQPPAKRSRVLEISDSSDDNNVNNEVSRARGRRRTRARGITRASSRCGFQTVARRRVAATDAELGWADTVFTPQHLPYTAVPGLPQTSDINADSSPFEIFSKFFSEEILKK